MIDLNGKNAVQLWPGPPAAVEFDPPPELRKWQFDGAFFDHKIEDIVDLHYITRRLGPFVKAVFFVPDIRKNGKWWDGLYSDQQVVLASNFSVPCLRSALYHELFHCVEDRMSSHVKSAIYKHVVAHSVDFRDANYLDLPTEKSARMFSNFCMFLDSGGIVFPNPRHPQGWLVDIFLSIYRGDFAKTVQDFDRREALTARRLERRAAAWRGVKSIFA